MGAVRLDHSKEFLLQISKRENLLLQVQEIIENLQILEIMIILIKLMLN